MKRINNLYQNIRSSERIIKEAKSIKIKNKLKKENFNNYFSINVISIYNQLNNETYKVGKYNIFKIYEPKERVIMSLNIKDKIVNNLVSRYILNILDKSLINENIATRKNKGSSYGIKLLKKYLNEIKDKEFYILKFDIKKYFYNINHNKLKEIIRNKIKEILKEYHLELDNKTKIYSKKEGITSLEFHFKIKNNKVIITLKNETKRKFKKRMKLLNELYIEKIINEKELKQILASYKGHLSKGKCCSLYRKYRDLAVVNASNSNNAWNVNNNGNLNNTNGVRPDSFKTKDY